MAARPSGVSVICHSSVSPALIPRKTQIPSGIVALSDFDFGRAIDVFDLRLMPFSMYIGLFISTYWLAEEFIYGLAHHSVGRCIWQHKSYPVNNGANRFSPKTSSKSTPKRSGSKVSPAEADTASHCLGANGLVTVPTSNSAKSNANTYTRSCNKLRRNRTGSICSGSGRRRYDQLPRMLQR